MTGTESINFLVSSENCPNTHSSTTFFCSICSLMMRGTISSVTFAYTIVGASGEDTDRKGASPKFPKPPVMPNVTCESSLRRNSMKIALTMFPIATSET